MTRDSIELTLHCLRSIRRLIEPDADAPMDGVWGLQNEVLAANLEGLSIAEDFFARHAEHADALTAENATLREERDTARVERDARPDITAEGARDLLNIITRVSWEEMSDEALSAYRALERLSWEAKS